MRNLRTLAAIAALCLAALGILGLARAGAGLTERTIVVDGVPLTEVSAPTPTAPRSGIVIAHGFAGSARLMAPYAETLARQGFIVVSLDFSGHGRNIYPLPANAERRLNQDLVIAIGHLRSLGIPPRRIGLLGHSMGAEALTRYASRHPEIKATVTLSLPDAPDVSLPGLLMLAGAWEPASFHHPGATLLPMTDHVTILYTPTAHRLTANWFTSTLDPRPVRATAPLNRLLPAALLLVAFTLGLYALPRHPALVLLYSAAAVAVPVHFGMTSVVLTGWRWLVLPLAILGCSAAGYGLHHLSRGVFWRHAGYSALGLLLLTVLAFAGLAPVFLLLIMPLLALLLLWQSIWVRLLTSPETPRWLPPVAGSLLVAIPLTAAVPLLTVG